MNSKGWIGLGCSCLLWGSNCTTPGKQIAQRHTFRQDSVRIERQDSVYFRRLLQAAGQTRMRLQAVTFTDPDSTGRPSIRTWATIDWQNDRQVSSIDTLQSASTQQTLRQTHASIDRIDSREAGRPGRFGSFFIRIGVGLLSLLLFVRMLKKLPKQS